MLSGSLRIKRFHLWPWTSSMVSELTWTCTVRGHENPGMGDLELTGVGCRQPDRRAGKVPLGRKPDREQGTVRTGWNLHVSAERAQTRDVGRTQGVDRLSLCLLHCQCLRRLGSFCGCFRRCISQTRALLASPLDLDRPLKSTLPKLTLSVQE